MGQIEGSQAKRLHFRIAGVSPVFLQVRRRNACKKRNAGVKGSHSPPDRGRLACMRLYSTANERGYISTGFLFAYRQSAGGTPAIRWSVDRFKSNPQITQIRKTFLGTSGTVLSDL
ncbi:MAG: hypothetical protein LBP59_12060 [Planctomycetaceae bacterium]|nr:hypothetical protein [Planctomycetaceae bacterium]